MNSIFDVRSPYELLIKKRYPGASIAVFDTNSLITDIYNNPTQYLTSPANVTGQFYHCDPATGGDCVTQEGKVISQFLWYDELHPTERTDQIIAKEFASVVKGTSKYATYW